MKTSTPLVIYIDMDDVICDFTNAYNRARQRTPSIKHPQSQYVFFVHLAPIKGAVESIKALIQSPIFEPYILAAPSTRNPLSYTEKRVWIENYFGYEFTKRLIICSNKGLLKGDYLIDDNTSGKGQENFEGKLLHFGSRQYPNWNSVEQELKLKVNICSLAL